MLLINRLVVEECAPGIRMLSTNWLMKPYWEVAGLETDPAIKAPPNITCHKTIG